MAIPVYTYANNTKISDIYLENNWEISTGWNTEDLGNIIKKLHKLYAVFLLNAVHTENKWDLSCKKRNAKSEVQVFSIASSEVNVLIWLGTSCTQMYWTKLIIPML